MLMMQMHGLGAVANRYGDPGDAANAPGAGAGSMGAMVAGGGGPVVAAIQRSGAPYHLVSSMNLSPSSGMIVGNLPTNAGPPGPTGTSILCPPGTAFNPATQQCSTLGVVTAPPPQTCPAGTTFEATTSSCVTAGGAQTPAASSCPVGSTMGADGACYVMQTDAPFTVPAWGWLAGVGVVGYLAYHFLIAK